ncbi:AAA family ATPase [Streptomyces malaysiensis subsp. malaysiensis]|uniref:AAA family ATPase n=1 Tax=Streptomyces malaysiensis TaxID=92644 RepID=UPI0024C02222|nr:AAA family ATPase [Streptomyces sp. NA07423]WHX19801.1 AAA family ATPase [Streptomyces sp. NA07423]
MSFTFAPATRETARARIGLQGPAGSGKTKTALRLAEGLAKGAQIGVVDTERGSALKYAPVPGRPDLGGHEFGHMPMDTHDPRHLLKAVEAAEAASIAVLIIDSWSHFWNGRGGLLEIVEEAGRKPGAGGSFGGWRTANPIEQDMLDALLNFNGHLIVTMRTKGDYVIDGKKVTKVGVKAVQREGAEYELDVVMDMVEGTATVTKTRYEPLENLVIHHPGPDVAETILEQLGQGVDPLAALVDALAGPVETLTLDTVSKVRSDAARRRLLEAELMHPDTGAPTTLGTLLHQRLGNVVVRLLADDSLTYQGALDLHARGKAEQWLDIQRAVEETGEVKTLGELIAARGREVKPTPAREQQPSATEAPKNAQERPRNAPPSGAQPTGANAASAPQMRKIFACLRELEFPEKDRAARLRAVGLILRREIESMNALTFGEAGDVIEHLESYTGRENGPDAFRAWLDAEQQKLAQAPAA